MLYFNKALGEYLREKYFKNDYFSFEVTQGFFVVTINNKKFEIPVFDYKQYQELQDEVEKKFIEKYPEIFL